VTSAFVVRSPLEEVEPGDPLEVEAWPPAWPEVLGLSDEHEPAEAATTATAASSFQQLRAFAMACPTVAP
jgi:hypothetical protein